MAILSQQNPTLPTPCRAKAVNLSRSGLPTPPPSSQLFSQDDYLISDLSDIEITSSPPPIKSVQSDETSRKTKHWQIEEDATIVKMVLLRKLFPHRTDIDWCEICHELARMSEKDQSFQPGRVRSRFFSTMHHLSKSYNVSHRDLCRQLAMPFDCNLSPANALPPQIMSDPLPIAPERVAATRKLNDLAFNAKLREARQALDAQRPDVVAQKRAKAALRSMRAKSTSSQMLSSSPARPTASMPGFNERMAEISILSSPVAVQQISTPRLVDLEPPTSAQIPSSQRSIPISTQRSEAAAQLQSDLTSYLCQPAKTKTEWEWSDQTRGYIPKVIPTIEQNMWRTATEVYNSAIAYNATVQKGKKKERVFVYEDPLMRRANSDKMGSKVKRKDRMDGRGFEGKGKRGKKVKKEKKEKRKKGMKKRADLNDSEGSAETSRRMKELQVRLEAKARGNI